MIIRLRPQGSLGAGWQRRPTEAALRLQSGACSVTAKTTTHTPPPNQPQDVGQDEPFLTHTLLDSQRGGGVV